jgi:predicted DsbA family dithiol-disulfide isomerase
MIEPARVVTLFTDFTSPAAYVTESALRAVRREHALRVRYHALEEHPAAVGPTDSAAWNDRIAAAAPLAEAEGLLLTRPSFVPRTRKAHEAALFAREHDLEEQMRLAIFQAFWATAADIGRIDVLTALGAGIGLEPAELKIALDIDRFRDAIERDGVTADRLKVRDVPTIYVGTGATARILAGMQTRAGLDSAIRTR